MKEADVQSDDPIFRYANALNFGQGPKPIGGAERYEVQATSVSDWRRMAREAKLVLPNLNSIDFVPVKVKEVSLRVPALALTVPLEALDII